MYKLTVYRTQRTHCQQNSSRPPVLYYLLNNAFNKEYNKGYFINSISIK